MITLTIILAILLAIVVITIIALVLGGVSFLLVFGDIIIAVAIIVALLKLIFRKRGMK